MNRATYRFNDKLDKAILRPVARGYRKVTPQFAQTGVRNFFDNLNYPIVMVNDLLQGQIKPFCSDTGAAAGQHDHRHRRTVRPGDQDGPGQERPRLRADARQVGNQDRALRGAAAAGAF